MAFNKARGWLHCSVFNYIYAWHEYIYTQHRHAHTYTYIPLYPTPSTLPSRQYSRPVYAPLAHLSSLSPLLPLPLIFPLVFPVLPPQCRQPNGQHKRIRHNKHNDCRDERQFQTTVVGSNDLRAVHRGERADAVHGFADLEDDLRRG